MKKEFYNKRIYDNKNLELIRVRIIKTVNKNRVLVENPQLERFWIIEKDLI